MKFYVEKVRFFFQSLLNIFDELKNITWQKNLDTIHYTIVVIASVLIISLVIWFFDFVFIKIIGWLMFMNEC